MKKVLITGISGMVGRYLSELLLNNGYEVAGLSRSDSKGYRHYTGDILDKEFLKKMFIDFTPDVVYHLAAQSFNSRSWVAEDATYMTNIQGTRNVLDACRLYSPDTRFIPACSCSEYGITHPRPMKEDNALIPISPYGVTKVCVENMTRQYHLNYDMDVVIPRMFLLEGIGRPPLTAMQNFCMQFALCTLNRQGQQINCGALKTERDFVDVRDGVKALLLLQERGVSGESYNICSGQAITMVRIIEMLQEQLDMYETVAAVDPTYLRPSDEALLVGDPSKINKLGWFAQIPVEQTIIDIYNDWVIRLK